jgi:hypothetical protein
VRVRDRFLKMREGGWSFVVRIRVENLRRKIRQVERGQFHAEFAIDFLDVLRYRPRPAPGPVGSHHHRYHLPQHAEMRLAEANFLRKISR